MPPCIKRKKDDLVGATNEVEIVFGKKLLDYVGAECERDASVVLTPTGDVCVGVTPQKITEKSRVGDVSGTHNTTYLCAGNEVVGACQLNWSIRQYIGMWGDRNSVWKMAKHRGCRFKCISVCQLF